MRKPFRLFVKKPVYVPTLWGWVLVLGCLTGTMFVCVDRAYPFLAYQNPNDSDVFIIEGWVPDSILDRNVLPIKDGHYRLLITTGGPLDIGSELAQYRTYAEVTAARLVKMGFSQDRIVALPSPPVNKDRTYASALEVRDWLLKNPDVTKANLITQGPHARRSFILFKAALPNGFELGAYATPSREYNPDRWWASSAGFRNVLSEEIAYIYTRLLGPD
ncbi:MAG: YdcF family protein [Solirubrobacterales bacterium]